MADRYFITRRGFLTLGILAVSLVLYLGSFMVIRWAEPRFIWQSNLLWSGYLAIYWPVRWLTADRLSFMPWWQFEAVFEGRYINTEPRIDMVLVTLNGEDHLLEKSQSFFDSLRPDNAFTALIRASLGNRRYHDFICPVRIETTPPRR